MITKFIAHSHTCSLGINVDVIHLVYYVLNQQIHIASGFRFIVPRIVIILRRLRPILLLEKARVLSHSIPPLLDYLNFYLNPIYKNPLYFGDNL
jgi:hypothetical protein